MNRVKVTAPRVVRHAMASFRDSLRHVEDIRRREDESIKYFQDHKMTTSSPRGDSIEIVPSLQLCMLPDVHGKQRADFRSLVVSEAKPIISELFGQEGKSKKRACVVFQGNVNGGYLRRIQDTTEAHVIVVEKTTDSILRHVSGCGFEDDASAIENFSFVRGNLMFVLQHLVRSASVDNIVLASPKPFPAVPQSHARVINRDFYLAAHKALKTRFSEEDSRGGLVAWTDYKPFWMFMHEQMDEAKLIVPFAKKKISVFDEFLPQQHEVRQRVESLNFFAAHKKSASSAAADEIIDKCSYTRQYYRALFDADHTARAFSGATDNRATRREGASAQQSDRESGGVAVDAKSGRSQRQQW